MTATVALLAAAGEVDLARLLLDLLVVLVAAKLAAELAERAGVPAVLGEIAAGIAIGPSALGLVSLDGDRGVSLGVLAEIGVLLLLLGVGMEMDVAELGKVGRASVLVAVVGVAVPFAAGGAVSWAFGASGHTAIFFGASLTATSVGITARVFGDLRALATPEARVVLGAAVADDVLGLVILTIVVKIVSGDAVGAGTIATTLGLALLFLAGSGLVGLLVVPRALALLDRLAATESTVVVGALAVMLAFAAVADTAKLAFIIGAFMAGLAIGRSRQGERVARDLGAVGNVLIPVFFVQIGIHADVGAMTEPSVLAFALVASAVAVGGKLVSAVGAIGTPADRLTVGIGMVPRGEVGLIFASVGLAGGVLDADDYGALLLVVLLTTVVAPPLLKLRLGRLRRAPGPADGAAVASWSPGETAALVDLLRAGDAPGWRALAATGRLEAALPEIAVASERHRAEMDDLDQLGTMHLPTVERLREHGGAGIASPALLLAAFATDACADPDGVAHLAARLAAPPLAAEIVAIVDGARLLAERAGDPAALDAPSVDRLAAQLGGARRAGDAYRLAAVTAGLPPWQHDVLAELHCQVQARLAPAGPARRGPADG